MINYTFSRILLVWFERKREKRKILFIIVENFFPIHFWTKNARKDKKVKIVLYTFFFHF